MEEKSSQPPDPVLILAYNESGLMPIDAHRLKRLLSAKGLKPVSVRVTPEYVEIHVYQGDYSRAVRVVEENIGAVLEVERASSVEKSTAMERDIERLFSHRLFWRAHVAAEEEWRRTGNEYYRLLAILAGIMVKAQEGEREPALRLIKTASLLASKLGLVLDEECLAKQVDEMLEAGAGNPLLCLEKSGEVEP